MKYIIVDLEDNFLHTDWDFGSLKKIKINQEDNIKLMKCLKKIIDSKRIIRDNLCVTCKKNEIQLSGQCKKCFDKTMSK